MEFELPVRVWPNHEELETILLFIGVFFIAYVYYKRTLSVDLDDMCPPMVRSIPFLGSLPFLPHPSKMHIWLLDKLPTTGSLIGFRARNKFSVVVQTREALNEAFVKHSSAFGSRPPFFVNQLSNPRACGIVEKPLDETFKKNHRLTLSILRTFGFGDRCVMENRINHEVENLVAELAQYQSKPVYPLMIVTGSVVNVIASILFGRHFERSDPDLADLIIHTNRFVQEAVNLIAVNLFPSLRYLPPVRRRIEDFSALQRWLLDFLQRKIDETLSREEDDDTASFIRSFIEAEGRNSYDRDELLFILRDMIVAGSETSATTVMWAIALLADHRDIQARLHDEIDAVVGVGGEVGVGRQRLPSLTDRSRLPYVEAFILEVMRFKTIVPLGVPRETVRETEIDGYTIPAGAMVMPNLYTMHMDPNVWKDPTTFRPERFLDEEGRLTGGDKVIPFSIGKRSCLGEVIARQEIFLFTTGLLQSFEIVPPEGQESLNCTENVGVTVAPSPFEVRFVSRR